MNFCVLTFLLSCIDILVGKFFLPCIFFSSFIFFEGELCEWFMWSHMQFKSTTYFIVLVWVLIYLTAAFLSQRYVGLGLNWLCTECWFYFGSLLGSLNSYWWSQYCCTVSSVPLDGFFVGKSSACFSWFILEFEIICPSYFPRIDCILCWSGNLVSRLLCWVIHTGGVST